MSAIDPDEGRAWGVIAALRAMGDVVMELAPDGRVVDDWGASEHFGFEPRALIGSIIGEVVPQPVAERFAAALACACSLGAAQNFGYESGAPGRTRHYEARIAPAASGRLVVVIRDIDGQKRAEVELADSRERLSESEERFRVMADNAPVMLWMSGTNSECEFFNRTWLEFSGRTLDEEIGVGWAEGVHPEDFQRCMDTYLAAFIARRPFRMEYRLRRHDGVYRWLFDNGVPRYSLGESFQGFIGSCVDITEMKEANDAVLASQKILVAKTRELERSNAELEQFAYVASHDLQEPLRMVVCYMELLERDYKGRLEDKADKFIQYAIDGAHRMKQLIDDLLAYSRIGTLGRPFERVDSGEVVRRAITALSLAIEEANAEIVVGEMPTLVADPVQLGQVFQNLLSNAIKFRGEQPPRVAVQARRFDDVFEFTIDDNGIGFQQEYADRIFQMFQRLHERQKYGGSGIGLALAKRVVERHGGTISVSSTPGVGSCFRFAIPVDLDGVRNTNLDPC